MCLLAPFLVLSSAKTKEIISIIGIILIPIKRRVKSRVQKRSFIFAASKYFEQLFRLSRPMGELTSLLHFAHSRAVARLVMNATSKQNKLIMKNEFLFAYEEKVGLKEDMPELDVSAGAVGIIWAFYSGGGYEVEFCNNKGQSFSTIMLEEQLEKLAQ